MRVLPAGDAGGSCVITQRNNAPGSKDTLARRVLARACAHALTHTLDRPNWHRDKNNRREKDRERDVTVGGGAASGSAAECHVSLLFIHFCFTRTFSFIVLFLVQPK